MNKTEKKYFEIEGQEYWPFVPPNRGTKEPSSWLRIVDDVLYQWWPLYTQLDYWTAVSKTGIWVQVQKYSTNENQKEKIETNRSSTETDEKGS